MKTITLFAIILTFTTVNSFSQITMESLDLEVPQLYNSGMVVLFPGTGPIMIVKAGKVDFQLDSIGFNRIDPDWIQKISVIKKSETGEMYGYPTENGLFVITLKEEHIEDFLSGKIVEEPLQIKRTQ